MGWQDEGITTTVEISTQGQFITPRPTTQIPFTSGGDRGQPAGWTAFQENMGSPYWAWFKFSTNTSANQFNIASEPANTGKHMPAGAKYSFAVTPGHTYFVIASVKVQEGYQPAFTGPKLSVARYAGGTFRQSISNMSYARVGMPDAENWYTIGVQQSFAADEGTMEISLVCNNTGKSPYGANSPDYGCTWSNLYMVDITPPDSTVPYNWHTVICDTKEVALRFGRARFTERYDVGTFNIRLNNVSGEYAYNENHPWGFRPGRLVRMTANHNGTTYPLCFGVIDRIATVQNLDGTASVTITAFDTTSFTSDTTTPAITTQPEGSLTPFYSGVRIKSLCTYVGIPQAQQQLDQGLWGMMPIRQSSRVVREEIGVTADSEGGSFYGERDGRVVYRDRSWSAVDPKANTVQAQITAYRSGITIDMEPDGTPTDPNAPIICPHNLETDWSLERVINYIRLGVAGGSPYVFQNAPSQSEYGVRTYQRLDYLNQDISASVKDRLEIRSQDIFSTSLDALLRVKRLAYRPTGTQWPFTLSVFLNWLVRVFYYNDQGDWGFSTVVRIQSIEHRITPTAWEVTFDVDQPIAFSDDVNPIPEGGWDTHLWDINIWDEAGDQIVPAEGAYWNSGQRWNGQGVTWLGRGWSSGISKWSNPDDDWKT